MRVTVIGAGSWGTAISWLLLHNGNEVTLWAHSADQAQAIEAMKRNPRYLSDVELPGIHATSDFQVAVRDAEALALVTPSSAVHETLMGLRPFVPRDLPVVMLSKGIERESGLLMTEICEEVLGNPRRIAALSGPNHAEEVSKGLPAATVVASSDEACAEFFQKLFMSEVFRVYTSTDVTGVEVCAASKNIIAIACGIAAGLGYGDNTAAVIMTRGLAEMSRLVVALGGDPLTCMGLAGMGDLVATCSSRHSRNRALGELIAAGGTLEQFRAKTHMVAEGAYAALSVTDLAERNGVELPLSQTVREVLWEGRSLDGLLDALMLRPPKPEFDGLR
jgi:glycerol-3-phosphate dehydrogenase (NAD(P)+)